MTIKETIYLYNLSTIDGLTSRISDYIERIKKEGLSANNKRIEHRWIGFDKLVSKLAERVQPTQLMDTADRLLQNSDKYMQNAGLTILGAPSVADEIIQDETKFRLTLSLLVTYIPSIPELSQLSDIDRANFIRSIEGMLQFSAALNRGFNMSDQFNLRYFDIHKYLRQRYTQIVSPVHAWELTHSCRHPDMQGTLIKQEYGEI